MWYWRMKRQTNRTENQERDSSIYGKISNMIRVTSQFAGGGNMDFFINVGTNGKSLKKHEIGTVSHTIHQNKSKWIGDFNA